MDSIKSLQLVDFENLDNNQKQDLKIYLSQIFDDTAKLKTFLKEKAIVQDSEEYIASLAH